MTRDRRLSVDTPSEWLTRDEVGEELDCYVDAVDRCIRTGALKALRDGGPVRISRADLKTYIQRSKTWHG